MQPLTHHDILALVEPFTRGGRQIDLAASDRIKRCLVFKPRASSDSAIATAALAEASTGSLPETLTAAWTDTLALDCLAADSFVLRRSVTQADALVANLVIKGADTASLLASVEAVNPQTLFRSGEGWQIAMSYRLEPERSFMGACPPPRAPDMLLTNAVVQVAGLTLLLKMPAVTGYPAELEITTAAAIDLPDDLLQVLGRDWSSLMRGAKSWKGTLRIRGKALERTRLAQDKLEAAARHMALTLSQPPAAFVRQQAGARWRVAGRRAVPMLTLVALVLGSLAVPYLGISPDSVYWMLIFNAPPLLLLWGFSLREMPNFALPRPPKRLTAASWWSVAPDAAPVMPASQASLGATAPSGQP